MKVIVYINDKYMFNMNAGNGKSIADDFVIGFDGVFSAKAYDAEDVKSDEFLENLMNAEFISKEKLIEMLETYERLLGEINDHLVKLNILGEIKKDLNIDEREGVKE